MTGPDTLSIRMETSADGLVLIAVSMAGPAVGAGVMPVIRTDDGRSPWRWTTRCARNRMLPA
jgi:hypothetical protein